MAAKGGFSGQQSAGTGMIISEDGYVLTNKHVVDAAGHLRLSPAAATDTPP